MPTPKMFKDSYDELVAPQKLRNKLSSLGYEKTGANTYVLNPNGNPTATVKIDYDEIHATTDDGEEVGGYSYYIYVTFPEKNLAANFVKNWGAQSGWVTVAQKGNTVELYSYGD